VSRKQTASQGLPLAVDKYRGTKPVMPWVQPPSQLLLAFQKAAHSPLDRPAQLCLNLSLYSCQFFLGAPPPQDGQAAFRFLPGRRSGSFECNFE